MVAWIAVQAGIAGGMLLGDYIYHRYNQPLPDFIPPQEVNIPRVDDGAPVPIIYGKCRVRAAILAWHDVPESDTGNDLNGWSTGVVFYRMDQFFVIGLGFAGTQGVNKFYGMWQGEKKFRIATPIVETQLQTEIDPVHEGLEPGLLGGSSYYYAGTAAQYFPGSWGGARMILAGVVEQAIPSYRGMISVMLYDDGGQWKIGPSPSVPAYSFEVSSYPPSGYPLGDLINADCNPIDALYDLLVTQFGKLGISADFIDFDSFVTAAQTLVQEQHGYSRAIEDRKEAREHIQEILRQIDAALFFDEDDVKFKIKLVRADFDPATIPQLTRENAVDLKNIAFGSWSNLINKVRVVYTNRHDDYRDGSETARNHANAVGQDGVVIEHVVEFRGVTYPELAYAIAHRELAHLSRPMIKCRAIVNRSFVRVNPGDPIRVWWSEPDISGIVFRVAAVDRGTLEDGSIALDLIQDANFSFRGDVQPPSFVDTGDVGTGVIGGFG